MSCRIIMDSGGESTGDMKQNEMYCLAKLSIDIEGETIVDESIPQKELLRKIAASPECPKSSCPSPEAYIELFKCEAEQVYVVTLSSELSGSYNSALLGVKLYKEEYGEKDIYIFDSKSASVGQTNICREIEWCESQGKSFTETVEWVEEFIAKQNIYFVLESLETLRKNGRITGIKSVLATALNIKPIMSANEHGVITQLSKARGVKKALDKMVEIMLENVKEPENKVLGIAHCNNPERAELVKQMVESQIKFKDIYIAETSGISTLYAADGGIIISV